MREITFKIEEKQDGLMIRDFLRNFGVSSALLTKLKQDENGISLNGEFAKAIAVLHTSDVLKIRIKNKGKMPEKFICDKVKVAYDDEDILVLNKPPLMPVHESRNHRGDTLYGGDCAEINRQALHCKTIYFTHPITNEKITVDSDFPDDFKGLI